MILNSNASYLNLPRAGIIAVCHHTGRAIDFFIAMCKKQADDEMKMSVISPFHFFLFFEENIMLLQGATRLSGDIFNLISKVGEILMTL